jgi:hypothetical protein
MSCAKSELCIFDTAMPQVVVDNATFEEIYPLNAMSDNISSAIEFNIIASNTEYLDLNDTMLFVELKVNNAGKDLDANADILPANYLFHTLFADALLYLNNEKIEGGNNEYSHKAMIETILNYSTDTMKTTLAPIGYDSNPKVRKNWISGSKSFSMCGSLQLDFFDQPKYLIPGVNVKLKLIRNASNYSLTSPLLAPKIKIIDAKLIVRRVKVDQSVLIGHQIGLNTQNAIYPFRKTQLVSYSVPKGSTGFYKDQIFGDSRLPKFILIAFQRSDQIIGNYTLESDIYQHFNVGTITLSRNNDYRESYTQDFESDSYVTSYVTSIIRNMSLLDKNSNNGITMADFKDLYPFFTFVLAPDFDIYQTQIPKQGNVRLDIKFNKPLPEGACIQVYGIFDGEIQINKNKTIFQ